MNNERSKFSWPINEDKQNDSTQKPDPIISSLCMKTCTLLNYITENPKAADLKWSLFCAACNSYRFDSVLKPFPQFFLLENDNKQIDRLREVVAECPSIAILAEDLSKNRISKILLNLLYWVLIHLSEPSFKYIPKEEHQEILDQACSVMPAALPDFIFSVTYGNIHQQKFALTATNRTTKFGFHGSRLDNFYSIVNHGLQVSQSKAGAFGRGIYLTSEIGMSLAYSPRSFTWNSSLFGSHISVVALCEIIDHPDVKSEKDSRCFFDTSRNSPLPGRYFIVKNDDLVRVRYLLVYSSDEPESVSLLESPTLLGWMRRHKMLALVMAYVILLLGIGSSNSSFFYKMYKRIFRQIGNQNY